MSRRLQLSNGGHTIVDDEDFDYLAAWNWQSYSARHVGRNVYRDGRNVAILMHHVVAQRMGLQFAGSEIDHENRDGFDNRRLNLRVATHSENMHNRGCFRNNTSGVTGVFWHSPSNKWAAQINVKGARIHLGTFTEFDDAAKARRDAETRYL